MIEIRDQSGDIVELRVTAEDLVEAGMMTPSGVILPTHPMYAPTLNQSLPPGWESQTQGQNQGLFVCRPGSDLLVRASERELSEYLYGGEYEQRQDELTENT